MGCLTLLSVVLGYAWAAGWLADAGAVEVSVGPLPPRRRDRRHLGRAGRLDAQL